MATTPNAEEDPGNGTSTMDAHTYIRTYLCPDIDEQPEAKAWADHFWEHVAARSQDD